MFMYIAEAIIELFKDPKCCLNKNLCMFLYIK